MKNFSFVILFTSAAVFSFGQSKEPASAPKMEDRIFDMANLLTPDQEKSIFSLIQELDRRVGSQIGVITIETLNGQPIEVYAKNMANQLGLRGKKRDGILIVFAVKDRKFRTEVSVGLEKIITNEFSTIVNQSVIAPHFKVRDYVGGFYNGIKAFNERIEANRDSIGK